MKRFVRKHEFLYRATSLETSLHFGFIYKINNGQRDMGFPAAKPGTPAH